MPRIEIATPRTIVLEFRQERGDPDYGSCLWATFNLDLDAYGMTILSDCGNYGHKWVPTRQSESFLHLLARMDEGYLLDKISSRCAIDDAATFAALKELIASYLGDEPDQDGETVDMDELRDACARDTDQEVHDAVKGLFEDTPMADADDYDIWTCIEKDFPLNAKKIASVFREHVAPMCAQLDAKRAGA